MNISDDLNIVLEDILEERSLANSTITEASYNIHAFISILATIVGVFGDVIIISIILHNARMSSRRNIILLNWAIFDALDFPPLLELIELLLTLIFPMDSTAAMSLDVCFLSLSTALFKFNCIFLMLLMVSTTVMRMQWITNRNFKRALYVITAAIYFANFSVCYLAGFGWIFVKFLFIYLLLLLVLITKEVYAIYRGCRDDPLDVKTTLKMNIVRIFTYNYLFIILMGFFAPDSPTFMPVFALIELSVHFTSVYILTYLYYADENFTSALSNMFGFCCWCKKKERTLAEDATVVYTGSAGEDRATIDFNRL